MKKFIKFCIILLIVFIALCQPNIGVKAYTTEEWKEIIEYKEVATDGEPGYSDVQINIDSLEPNAGFPIVQATSELLLFGKDRYEDEDIEKFQEVMKGIDFFDIDFFNSASENLNDSWKKVRDFVQLGFRVTLYIAIAAMITQLIYIGVIIVKSAMFGERASLPYERQILSPYRNILDNNEGNINKKIMHKKLIEQWVISLFLLVFIAVGLSSVIYFSKTILAIEDAEMEVLNIDVYVKDETNATSSSNRGYYFRANTESVLLFQSQHLVKKFAFQNFVLILRALLTILAKYVLLFFLLIRLIIVAVTIAVAPALVFINNIIKSRGNRGFLLNWLILFTIIVLARPLLAGLYGII